jgi:hypothetical protein
MKVFKTFIFYPILLLVLAWLTSENRMFIAHRGWWFFGIFLFLLLTIDMPLVFGPYYEELRKRKLQRETNEMAGAASKED